MAVPGGASAHLELTATVLHAANGFDHPRLLASNMRNFVTPDVAQHGDVTSLAAWYRTLAIAPEVLMKLAMVPSRMKNTSTELPTTKNA